QLAFLQRSAHDADAERLAENQYIARPRAVIAFDAVGMNQSEGDETINGLERIDRMSARDRDVRLSANRLSAGDDALYRFDRDLRYRHPQQRKRHERRAAHSIDIRDRVRSRNASEVERIIDDRHEEISRRDDRLTFVDSI